MEVCFASKQPARFPPSCNLFKAKTIGFFCSPKLSLKLRMQLGVGLIVPYVESSSS